VSLPVIFREEAEADMAEAALWYERRSLGLGAPRLHGRDDHASIFTSCLSCPPEIFSLLRLFPYLIICRAFPDFISIVAVIHGKRRPRRWQARRKEDENSTFGGPSPSGQGQGLLEGFMLEGAGHAMDFLAVGADFLGNAAP